MDPLLTVLKDVQHVKELAHLHLVQVLTHPVNLELAQISADLFVFAQTGAEDPDDAWDHFIPDLIDRGVDIAASIFQLVPHLQKLVDLPPTVLVMPLHKFGLIHDFVHSVRSA